MSVQTVARRYASALADVILERREAREVQQELAAWEEMMRSNPNLREVFANPTIALDKKRKVLNRVIELSRPRATTVNFLKVLVQNQRLTELTEINQKLVQLLDERAGLVAATVTTARPIPKEVHDRLSSTLTSLTGKKVRIDFVTDPNLIGGVVTRIGSTVYDGSVRNQLEQLKHRMAEGGTGVKFEL
ncbi:MAG TPA: ATP synthase F1 subunit delta [Pyrinomonadaceae bacterium]|jgi:F-type H+-transporting ATPase subunit delta|nr:ATP synthase F1 subunit delta [Pyrinomonadaceae bacterium]